MHTPMVFQFFKQSSMSMIVSASTLSNRTQQLNRLQRLEKTWVSGNIIDSDACLSLLKTLIQVVKGTHPVYPGMIEDALPFDSPINHFSLVKILLDLKGRCDEQARKTKTKIHEHMA